MRDELPFRARRLVRFADCDPAGIVYFPRYFDFFHAAVEDWFREGLELDYWGMLRDRRLGLPAVHTSCDFRRPSRMGEELRIAVLVERVGTSSLALRLVVSDDQDVRAEGRLIQVAMPFDAAATIPIPDDLRTAFLAYQRACPPSAS